MLNALGLNRCMHSELFQNWCPCPCQGSILHPLQEDFCLASCKNIQNKHNNTPSLTTISYLWIDNDGTESSLFLFKNAQKRTFLCYEVINWWLLVTVSVWLWIMAIDRSQHPDIHVSSMVTLVHKTLETIWINLPFMNI